VSPDLLRGALRLGVLALLVLAPLPFGAVRPGAVLAIELAASALGLIAILLVARDPDAAAAVPRLPLAIALGLVALGAFQALPLPFAVAETFNPTAELVRPLIPYLGLDRPPAVAWSVAAPETVDALLRLVAYVLLSLAAAIAFDDAPSRRRFAMVLVGSAVFQAVYGSAEYLSGHQHIFAFAKKHYLDSATGTFINRNHLATYLAMALPFGLALSLPEERRVPERARTWRERLVAASSGSALVRLLAAGACALLWMGLLLSHSRAGLVAALAAAAIVLVRYRTLRAARWAAAIGACVLLTLLTLELAQAPGERFFSIRDDIEARGGRLAVWRDASALVAVRPILGWGFGTFESAFPTVQSADIDLRYDHAHNDWLEWSIDGGLLALAAAIALLVLALRPPRPAAASGFDAAFGVAARAAVVAAALHGAWDFSLRIPAVAVVGAVVLGGTLGDQARAISARAEASAALPPPSTKVWNHSSRLSRFQTRWPWSALPRRSSSIRFRTAAGS